MEFSMHQIAVSLLAMGLPGTPVTVYSAKERAHIECATCLRACPNRRCGGKRWVNREVNRMRIGGAAYRQRLRDLCQAAAWRKAQEWSAWRVRRSARLTGAAVRVLDIRSEVISVTVRNQIQVGDVGRGGRNVENERSWIVRAGVRVVEVILKCSE